MAGSDDDFAMSQSESDEDSDFGAAPPAPKPKKVSTGKAYTAKKAKKPAAKKEEEDDYLDLTQDEEPAVLAYEPEGKPEAKPKKPKAAKKPPATLKRELPLVLAPSAGRDGKSTLLLELDERAGGFGVDTGAIGRASFPRVDGRRKFRLDLRGQEYDATIRPCPTMLVVNAAGDEAKVETVLSEYVTLRHTRDATTDRGYAGGDFDDGYRNYAGDVNVNARGRKGRDSDSDSDGPKTKKAKAAKPKKPRKPAARKKKA